MEPEIAEPVVDETPQDQTPPAGGQVTPPEKILDLSEYDDYVVPVIVNGATEYLPVSEVKSGGMRQADYTRKTQEVASERERLDEARAIREALEIDPQGTLDILSKLYLDDIDDSTLDEELDPLEREVKELRQYVDAQTKQSEVDQLWAELDGFHERYGVDQEELLTFAVENGIPELEWAHAVMELNSTKAEREAAAAVAAAEAARNGAKAGAGLVSGGSDRPAGGSVAPIGGRENVRSVDDAFELAKIQLGM